MKTRDRIIQASLELFNSEGEPNVTTVDISNELDISPGNLYYHFRGKEELVGELFARFHEQFNVILREPMQNSLRMEDYWLYLVVVFEHIYDYRFFYHNLSLIMQRYDQIRKPFRRLLHMKQEAARAICYHLRDAKLLAADTTRIDLISRGIALTITYWFDFDKLQGGHDTQDERVIHDGVLQVLALLVPYLGEREQAFMDAALMAQPAPRPPKRGETTR